MNEEMYGYLTQVQEQLEEQRLEAIRQLGRTEGAQALVTQILRRMAMEAQELGEDAAGDTAVIDSAD